MRKTTQLGILRATAGMCQRKYRFVAEFQPVFSDSPEIMAYVINFLEKNAAVPGPILDIPRWAMA